MIPDSLEDFYPLAPTQEGMLFHALLSPGEGLYCDQVTYTLEGSFDFEAYRQAWRSVVARHAALRTSFVWENVREPIQVVHKSVDVPITMLDWRDRDTDQQRSDLTRLVIDERRRGFDVRTVPLVRVTVIRLDEDHYHLIWTWHHLILDGWSIPLITRDVVAAYEAARTGRTLDLPAPRPFKDYIKWLRRQDTTGLEEFWRARLAGFAALTRLTFGPSTTSESTLASQREHLVVLPASAMSAVQAFGRREHLTLNTIVQGLWGLTLARFSGEMDVLYGATVAGRPAELDGAESMVGMFINTVPVRVQVPADAHVADWLRQLQKDFGEARPYEYSPLSKVQQWSDLPRGLFETILVFENFPDSAFPTRFADLAATKGRYETRTNYPLTVMIVPADDLSIRFFYDPNRFDERTIHALGQHMLSGLQSMIALGGESVSSVSFLTDEQRQRLLVEWNTTAAPYPSHLTVAQLFEAQAAQRPESIAVSSSDATLTYAQLNSRANAVARELRARGIEAGVVIGLCMDRSVDLLVALLGISKAGGAYVPLDPSFPPDRLTFMLRDSAAPILLTQTSLRGVFDTSSVDVICFEQLRIDSSADAMFDLGPVAMPDDLAYVLYTSGSTGWPKGVEISHRALTNFLWAMKDAPGCTADDVLWAITTLSFDIAGLELYLPLVVGGRVELVGRTVVADARLLRERLASGPPTILQATPATWRMLIEAGWTGTPGLKALIGGEPLPADLVQPLLDRVASLWNMYGPTETTIWSSVKKITTATDEITVGRPIANTTFYILDARRQPVPVGVPGELYIGGDGVARGYRFRPDLTAERFLADPFARDAVGRMYRTGDLARYRDDGEVVHLGRLDHQVKIRGFRIELGEIEATLSAHPAVAQSAVVARDDEPGATYLVAYVTWRPGQSGEISDLRQHLRRSVPDYMVPQYFVALGSFPLTPNGKIDRKRLPKPIRRETETHADRVEPRTPVEQQVAAVFSDIFKVPSVGAFADFFELGGHSLMAVRLVSRLESEFNVELPLHVLFRSPTVATLSDEIRSLTRGAYEADRPLVVPGVQRRPPRTATEHRLKEIWERVLIARDVAATDSFLALQGARTLIDPMLTEVRQAFGVSAEGLPVSTFMAEPTIESLGRLIDGPLELPSTQVVPLRTGGSKSPLFLVHAGGGYVFFYRALVSRLTSARPVYAIRALTRADRVGRPFDRSRSVEALAAQYVEAIRTVQRHGPYRLGGACFGGVLAFEMARQLRRDGERIEGPVLLFDAFLRESFVDPEQTQAHSSSDYALARAGVHWRRSVEMTPWKAARYLFQTIMRNVKEFAILFPAYARTLKQRIVTSALIEEWTWSYASWRGHAVPREIQQARMMKRFLDATFRLLVNYRAGVFDGDLAIFWARGGPSPVPQWQSLAQGRVVAHDLLGVHLDMMEEPTVAETARLVREHLGDEPASAEVALMTAPVASGQQ